MRRGTSTLASCGGLRGGVQHGPSPVFTGMLVRYLPVESAAS
jgi:hypothetical protein